MGTGIQALAAADTLAVIGRFTGVNIQTAHLVAGPAMGTLFLVQRKAVQGKPVKKAINGAQGAEIPAERPVLEHRQHQYDH